MEEKEPNMNTERITVYASPSLKAEMERFATQNNFSSLSSLLKRGYSVLTQVMTLDGYNENQPSLRDQINEVLKKLEEIKLDKILKKQQEEIINQEFENIPPDEIPSFEEISEKIIELIMEFNGIKDFVLMDHLREQYSEGLIWAVLVKLEKKGTIKLKDGEWKLK